jgi:hypothetical protein
MPAVQQTASNESYPRRGTGSAGYKFPARDQGILLMKSTETPTVLKAAAQLAF